MKYKIVMLATNEEDNITMANNLDLDEAQQQLKKLKENDIHYFEIREDKNVVANCPYCCKNITVEEYKVFGMCAECYDNGVE